jgi:hypothetical protein
MSQFDQHIIIREDAVEIPKELFGQDEKIIAELAQAGVLVNQHADFSTQFGRKKLKQVRRVPPIDLAREFQWLERHKHEYAGKWVAVEGDKLISVGDNAKEVYAAARAGGIASPFVEFISPTEDLPFGGW